MASFSRVLVAGGAGFIGSHIVDRLIEEKIEVVVLDNLFAGQMRNIKHHANEKQFKFVKGDVRDFKTVKRAMKNVDAVVNEAAVVSVRRSMEIPLLANEVNVCGTLNLLKASVDCEVKRFVQASSASVYGNAEKLPVTEDQCPNPISPYAVAELAAENYVKVFCSTYQLETVCLRYFNVYGPRQAASAYSGVTTIFLNLLRKGQRPAIFGDGQQTRDFVYVKDVVEANMLALNMQKATGEVFNIATGVPSSINEVLRELQKGLNKQHLKPVYKPANPGEIKHSYASIEKAKKTLRYAPKYSIKKGLQGLVKWYAES